MININNFCITNAEKKLNLIKQPTYKIGKKLGKISIYGDVYELNDNLVLKTVRFDNFNDKYIFDNEISVGSNVNLSLKNVGPCVLAYNKQPYVGYIIMEHLKKGAAVQLLTYYDFITQYYSSLCPYRNSPIVKLFERKLFLFYTITKGFHGDLHTDNIMCLLKGDKLIDVKIYDYGAHRKVDNIEDCKSINEIYDKIDKKFKNNKKKVKNKFKHDGNIVLVPNKGQPYRSNVNLLKKVFKSSIPK